MTREEAIDILQGAIKKPNTKDGYLGQAIDMAIEALEQKPKTIQEIQAESEKYQKAFEDGYEQGYAQARFDYEQEPCEDAISRKAVLDAFWKLDVELRPSAIDAILNMVNELPSVKPQRTGHWKLVQRGKSIDICCSNCEKVRIKQYAYNYTIDQLDKEDLEECFECADMRYCPNCGAKMESEVEE